MEEKMTVDRKKEALVLRRTRRPLQGPT